MIEWLHSLSAASYALLALSAAFLELRGFIRSRGTGRLSRATEHAHRIITIILGLSVIWATISASIDFSALINNTPVKIKWFLNSWVAMVVAPALGVAFFWMRCRRPLYYGLTEVAVGVVAIVVGVSNTSDNVLSKVIGILGGIYILVRGLDNMDKRLKGPNGWTFFFWGRVVKDSLTPASP